MGSLGELSIPLGSLATDRQSTTWEWEAWRGGGGSFVLTHVYQSAWSRQRDVAADEALAGNCFWPGFEPVSRLGACNWSCNSLCRQTTFLKQAIAQWELIKWNLTQTKWSEFTHSQRRRLLANWRIHWRPKLLAISIITTQHTPKGKRLVLVDKPDALVVNSKSL